MSFENSVHFAFNTPLGREEWNASLPSGGALIHLGTHGEAFTVAMFHQIRCLAILGEILEDFYSNSDPQAKFSRPRLAKHCMNYLRQMVLCNADLQLESVRAAKGNELTDWQVTHSCKDWSTVFRAAEENYARWISQTEG